ncbi:division/cell wall cluster transcriptional repressor MraZ [Candidatus Gottesmanbacteria bacterium RIFCSPHIGHO2_01_FULL_46_14]|uniref:Transcriptional regulator MraZ n=2 Tax=Candidatus Gottesmaniibacteriota TaxID=1752720 RepID=A0A1F5ZMV1_9BACT|nr:MAG: division/cell wall cluster transcriptional repressor MraZ [Candidatus Gottesmanbacteria bacterium RIFCSPHIGHO2_01_FULL_46_14]OGG28831.1 MAG: division/cell wall cluster transcriptional repressor MraZ [Candidatus Gottesmanbacteria bacterium RIFCSPLOWO2_01_FULL_46_21]
MKLFLGEYGHSLDDRARVTLPRKIRQEIDERELILAKGFDPCIFGFDRGSWEREAAKHLDTPVTDMNGRKLRRYLFSSAEKVEIDKLGRILVPAQLKEYAAIVRDVTVIGAGDHFEIWKRETWERYRKDLKEV